MYSAFANTFIVFSIGILMAHAMDAFARVRKQGNCRASYCRFD